MDDMIMKQDSVFNLNSLGQTTGFRGSPPGKLQKPTPMKANDPKFHHSFSNFSENAGENNIHKFIQSALKGDQSIMRISQQDL
jgi:hypothetical protein